MATGSLSISASSDQPPAPIRTIMHELCLVISEARIAARAAERLATAEGLGRSPSADDFDLLRYHLQIAQQAVTDARAAVVAPVPRLTVPEARTRAEVCRKNLAELQRRQTDGHYVSPRCTAYQERKLREAEAIIAGAVPKVVR